MAVGQNIKEWREKRSYSQVELARLVGISANSLYRIERESNIPRPQTLRKIAEVLDVPPEMLLAGTETKTEAEPEVIPIGEIPAEEITEIQAFSAPEQIAEPEVAYSEEPAEEIVTDKAEPVVNIQDPVKLIEPVQPVKASSFVTNKVVLAALGVFFIVVVGLIIWNVAQSQQIQTLQASQTQNALGLDLLTSTEITNDRINPVAGPQEKAHGHWFHLKGSNTQVLVIEFMPPLAAGEAYYGWFQLQDGSWQLAAHFTLDDKGYARTILEGSDGSNVKMVVITKQTSATNAPAGTTILKFP